MWNRLLTFARTRPTRSALAVAALALALAVLFADALLASPIRSWAERTINANLKGYRVRIARARPHLWKLGLDLDGVVLTQDRHPDPPVADIGSLAFTLQWSRLVELKLAANLTLVHPALHVNLAQIQEESSSQVSLKEEGWQRAVESIYPFQLDEVRIEDGSMLYRSAEPAGKAIRLTEMAMVAQNIRNKAAARDTYPSPVALEAVMFDTGKLWFKGAADFLREPYSAARGEVRLERVPLDRPGPLAQDYNLKTTGGLLSARGSVEYTPKTQSAHLTEVRFEDLRVDYVTSMATRKREALHARQAEQLAKQVGNSPQMKLQIDALSLTHSQIGFMDESARPPYRVFMADASLKLDHLSNQANQGRSEFHAQGNFMGSGRTVLSGGFIAAASPADFAIQLQLDDARLTDLNPFLQSQAGVDVADGQLSVYTELTVKGGRVEGYVKPLVRNLRVSDKRKDQGKPFGKRVEMHVLQGLADLFKNSSTRQVATVTRISGSTSDPRLSEWQAIRRLLSNGLFRAILPGFLEKGKELKPEKPS